MLCCAAPRHCRARLSQYLKDCRSECLIFEWGQAGSPGSAFDQLGSLARLHEPWHALPAISASPSSPSAPTLPGKWPEAFTLLNRQSLERARRYAQASCRHCGAGGRCSAAQGPSVPAGQPCSPRRRHHTLGAGSRGSCRSGARPAAGGRLAAFHTSASRRRGCWYAQLQPLPRSRPHPASAALQQRHAAAAAGAAHELPPLRSHPTGDGSYIVRFKEYRMAADHHAELQAALGGRGAPEGLAAGGWEWVPRNNPAAAHPTDFALLRMAPGCQAALQVRATASTLACETPAAAEWFSSRAQGACRAAGLSAPAHHASPALPPAACRRSAWASCRL